MSGSGARDGYGLPPWDPADPVPDLDDTQAIPGLGTVPGPTEPPGHAGAFRPGDGAGYGTPGGSAGTGWSGAGGWREQAGYGDSRPGQGRSAFDATRDDLGAVGPDSDAQGGRDSADGSGGQGSTGKPGGPGPGGKPTKRRRSFWRELPVLIVVALVLALLIKSFVIQAFYIPSASMQNTLGIGDRVLINKIVFHTRPIHRGDIIVFDGTGSWDFDNPPASKNIFSKGLDELEGIVGISHDSTIYIKRVIGLPGDHVACPSATGALYVNGVALSESSYLYPGNAPCDGTFSAIVPAGSGWRAITAPFPTTPAATRAIPAAGRSRRAPSSAAPS